MSIWDPVMSRFEKRLGWKENLLFKRGWLALVKSTLSKLPIYYFSLLTIPIKVAKRLETIQNRFLWSDVEDNRKYHVVMWSEVKLPVERGGLGVRSLFEMNLTLQGK